MTTPIGQAGTTQRVDLSFNIGPNLAAALVKLQGKLPETLERDRTVDVEARDPSKNYSYAYATLSAITRLLRPLLAECGLAYSSFPTTTAASDGKPMLVLRYHLVHESGEVLTGEFPISGEGMQARGGAITYARRYCLLAVTGLAADEDDDAAAEQAEREATGRTVQRTQRDRATRTSNRQRSAPADAGTGDNEQEVAMPGDPNAPISDGQRTKIMAQFRDIKAPKDRETRIRMVRDLVGRADIGSTNDLTAGEAHDLINTINQVIGTENPMSGLHEIVLARNPERGNPPATEPDQPTGGE